MSDLMEAVQRALALKADAQSILEAAENNLALFQDAIVARAGTPEGLQELTQAAAGVTEERDDELREARLRATMARRIVAELDVSKYLNRVLRQTVD